MIFNVLKLKTRVTNFKNIINFNISLEYLISYTIHAAKNILFVIQFN
jgi:hypothetical protein